MIDVEREREREREREKEVENHLGYSPIMLGLMKGVGDNPSWDTNRLSLK